MEKRSRLNIKHSFELFLLMQSKFDNVWDVQGVSEKMISFHDLITILVQMI